MLNPLRLVIALLEDKEALLDPSGFLSLSAAEIGKKRLSAPSVVASLSLATDSSDTPQEPRYIRGIYGVSKFLWR
jgi:hypothetical protein